MVGQDKGSGFNYLLRSVLTLGLLGVVWLAAPVGAERPPAALPAPQATTTAEDTTIAAIPTATAPTGAETNVAETTAAVTTAAATHAELETSGATAAGETLPEPVLLSPYWGPTIQQWAEYISILSAAYGFHPDFIAAVIKHESDGDDQAVSYMGAVGLMGVMPTGPGLEWRPSPQELLTPTINLRWGMAILSAIVRQSGGDVYAALAAYNGGWDQVNSREPRDYAAAVLDSYARAVVVRAGLSPEMADEWTLAIEMVAGHVPSQHVLILGSQPSAGLRTYAAHTLYRFADEKSGQTYYVRGYAVPVDLLAAPAEAMDLFDDPGHPTADTLEAPLDARLSGNAEKQPKSDPHVVLACLPSLDRLRGHASTRWFAPSSCPSWHR